MAQQVRELFEKHNISDAALRTILVPPPVLSYSVCQRPPSTDTEKTLMEIQAFIRTLIAEVATPLVEARAAVPFFVVSAVLDAMHRMTITPPHAFFLALFLRTAIREGRLCENVLVDGEPATVLTSLCNDIAGVEQYGVVLYNQALTLECFVDLLYRADRAHHGPTAHCSSALDMDVMDVLCATQRSQDDLFAAVGKALDAVADALCAELREEALTMNVTGGPSWATIECDRTGEDNGPVTSAMGRNVRGYLLYLHARLVLCAGARRRHHDGGAEKDIHVAARCPVRMVSALPQQTSTPPSCCDSSVSAPEQKELVMPSAVDGRDVYVQFRGDDARWVRLPRASVERLWPEHCDLLLTDQLSPSSVAVVVPPTTGQL